MSEPIFLTEDEAADFLVMHPKTLARWRLEKKGPPYVKFRTGAIRYDRIQLVAWATQERVPGDGTAA